MVFTSLALAVADAFGVGLYRKAKREEIAVFLRSLRPVQTEHRLVRMGPDGDGGYLLPDDFENVSAVYSPGVAEVADFELSFAKQGVPCFLLDFSVEGSPVNHPLISFSKRFLGSSYLSHFVSLEDWLSETPEGGRDAILQMDIEGGEWNVLLETNMEVLKRFRMMVIEFHGFDQRIGNKTSFDGIAHLFEAILQNFYIVHIHANNCCGSSRVRGYPVPPVVEISFIRKDRVFQPAIGQGIPHALDHPNVPGKNGAKLPAVWQ